MTIANRSIDPWTGAPYTFRRGEQVTSNDLQFVNEIRRRLLRNKVTASQASRNMGHARTYLAKILAFDYRPSITGALEIMQSLNFPQKTQRNFLRNYIPVLH